MLVLKVWFYDSVVVNVWVTENTWLDTLFYYHIFALSKSLLRFNLNQIRAFMTHYEVVIRTSLYIEIIWACLKKYLHLLIVLLNSYFLDEMIFFISFFRIRLFKDNNASCFLNNRAFDLLLNDHDYATDEDLFFLFEYFLLKVPQHLLLFSLTWFLIWLQNLLNVWLCIQCKLLEHLHFIF